MTFCQFLKIWSANWNVTTKKGKNMTKNDILNNYNHLISLIINKKIYQAISMVKKIAAQTPNYSTDEGIEMVEGTYKLMLKYSIMGLKDPNRDNIFRQLQISLMMMADSIKQQQLRKFYPTELTPSHMPKLPFKQMDKDIDENTMSDWFNFLVTTDNISQDVELQINNAINDSKFKWYYKSLIISALTISLIYNFDIKKINILTRFYESGQEQIWQRALVGLFLTFYIYNTRLKLYPECKQIIDRLQLSENFTERYEAVVIQFIKAIGTEKITKQINDEIIPEMTKIVPGIKAKMESDARNEDKTFDEENPDWNDYFKENPGFLDKLAEISKLQMEGGDVFINTFSMLKTFKFFNKLSNWFIPFYTKNPEIKEISCGEKINMENFIKGLYSAPFICNSDKYSFCLSVNSMPDEQKATMGKYFNAEINQMNDIAEDDRLLHQTEISYKIITQYIQDLYRFFKINRLGKELNDIFETKFNPANTLLFNAATSKDGEKRKIGEFFFANGYYNQAYGIFEEISKENPDFEIFQKMGYSAQKQENYNLALKNYLNAQLFNSNQAWNLKKIGYCYRKLKQPEKALDYYLKAEAVDSDNLSVTTAIGRCQLEMENYEQALKYYFKVEYLDPGNTKRVRPIAWCNYVLGKYPQAEKYCKKIPENEISAEDLVLAGHIKRMLGQTETAINYYTKALKFKEYDINKLEDALKTDFKSSENQNIEEENNLILDYIQFNQNI